MDYYTLQVNYGSSTKPKLHEVKNLGIADSDDFQSWTSEIRRRVYTTGFNITEPDGKIYLVSPFSVLNAHLIKQAGKV